MCAAHIRAFGLAADLRDRVRGVGVARRSSSAGECLHMIFGTLGGLIDLHARLVLDGQCQWIPAVLSMFNLRLSL